LKTEASNLGARFVTALSQRMEAQARAGDLSQAPGLIQELRVAFEAAKNRLRTHAEAVSRRTA